ncbi:SHOCT domain-containing protein, partial [Alphaproteobacteria bacterium]|nr:SHOCT domain-containing protein [Alphaproteobacteria bacterium]
NYSGANENKNFYKRVKGSVAYTNWDLFLIFNRGMQEVHSALVAAGVGWAGSTLYGQGNANWTQHKINWKYELQDGCPNKSMIKVYQNLDSVINKLIINFLLERDNYQSNLDQLILALEKDKKDDYGEVAQMLKAISDPNYIHETNSTNEEKNTDEDSSTNSSDDIRSQLKKLKSFFEEGLISEDDYVNKKKELLDKL